MIERGELLTVCRQIGSMMEAGVDILRITRVLRAQTENPRLLQAYDALDHDLTMGLGLADAMARAPEIWSPFAVSLVQQGEARNDLAGAFNQIADFMAREESDHAAAAASSAEEKDEDSEIAPVARSNRGVSSPLTVIALDGLIDRLQTLGLRSLTLFAGLLLTLASVWWAVEIQFIERRWLNVTLFSVAALFMGGAGVLVQRRLESERRREARCSFCGVYSPNGEGLERAPRFQGAAICPRCAAIIARRYGEIGEDKSADAPRAKEASADTKNSETVPNGVASSFTPSKVAAKKTPEPVSDWAEAEEIYD